MKKLFFVSMALGALACAAKPVYIPEASEENIQFAPLAKGESAYVDCGDNTAVIYIGGDKGTEPMRVSDPSALRGNRTRALSTEEYAIGADSTFTFNGSEYVGMIYAGGSTGVVQVVVNESMTIIDHVMHFTDTPVNPDIEMMSTPVQYTSEVKGNIITIKFYQHPRRPAGATDEGQYSHNDNRVKISSFDISVARYGETFEHNDLLATRFSLIDSLGEIDFGNLRYWAKHLYDGNRGENWSKYPAVKSVDMNGNALAMDANRRYRFGIRDNALHLDAANHEAFTVYSDGGSATTGYTPLTITGISVTTNLVTLTFTNDITDFDPSHLMLEWTSDIKEPFVSLFNPTHYSVVGNNTIKVSRSAVTGNCGLFKLSYEGGGSAVAYVSFGVEARFENKVIIKGDDGYHYQLHINGGTISATRVD